MTKRMLIDATHPEETRVVVVDSDQLVDFDFESSTKTQLKGNVYLAKVTRVEPSLQAAFVEYGGNRHGFLAFSEIHPDYYQIPQADREMLERLEREAIEESRAIENAIDPSDADQPDLDEPDEGDDGDVSDVEMARSDEAYDNGKFEAIDEAEDEGDTDDDDEPPPPAESVNEGSEQETEEVMGEQVRRRARLLRSYKIQEVIKRRQILLVQVVKEERGNKGAALTTYLSLAGRYCVLMPNTPRGGGISRKITNANDRRRLKTITQGLDVPQGMGLIVRTAGQERNKSEIKRDYDYLLRQWSEIRDNTLESVAPSLIYQEGNLIKRAMRDLYARDVDEVLVEGEDGYRSGKKLMQMMMPSHARKVKLYKDDLPLFYRYKVEDQLDGMHSPVVELPSGGSIVIHTTEALTAIDVNSGRSTRERHIDETAVKTNIEAADEVARQLRLRDLAGLVVIDFIDMSEHRHQRQVERRFREALKLDRARLQVGRISMFGLLELSRQRLRASLLELSSQACPVCSGLGVVRSTESCALHALRCVQEEGIKNEAKVLQLSVPAEVALYLLNQKRESLLRLEARYEMKVLVTMDNELLPSELNLETVERREREGMDDGAEDDERPAARPERHRGRVRHRRTERSDRDDGQDQQRRGPPSDDESGKDAGREEVGRKRRRRRRRRGRDEEAETLAETQSVSQAEGGTDVETLEEVDAEQSDAAKAGGGSGAADDTESRPRRRRRRRGRGDRDKKAAASASADNVDDQSDDATGEPADFADDEGVAPIPVVGQAEELLAKLQAMVAIEPRPPRNPKPVVADDGESRTTPAEVVDVAAASGEPELDDGPQEIAASDSDAPAEFPASEEVEDVPSLAATADDVGGAGSGYTEPEADAPEPAMAAYGLQEAQSADAAAQSLEPEAVVAADSDEQVAAAVEPEAGEPQPERRGWWSRWVK